MSSQLHHQSKGAPKKDSAVLIIILCSIVAIGPLTIDMYLPAFSAIAKSFDATDSLVQLSLTAYFIGITFGQLLYGPMADRFGKKPPLFFGLVLFVIASFFCYFSHSIEELIFWRFFQAVGACAGAVIPRAIVRDIFSPQESGRIFSHLILVMGIAPIIAPLLGNLFLITIGWQAIFGFLALFGIICLLTTKFLVPETRGANPDEKISHALKKYFGILHDRNFVISALSGGFAMAGLFAYITGSPFAYLKFFQTSPQNYGFIFVANAFGFVIAAQINAALLKKFSLTKVMSNAVFLPLIFGILLIFCGFYIPTFWIITLLFFAFLASVGAIVPTSSALALANQASHSVSASALFGTIQFIIATISSFAISKLHNGGIEITTSVVGFCAIASCLVYKIFKPQNHFEESAAVN